LFFKPMRNIKLVLEYDGTNYVGWQIQPNGPSIQEHLQKALHQILQEDVQAVAAGRTDAGVHARGQVINFKTSRSADTQTLAKSLNGVLPTEIVVLSAEDVADNFHARYSAKARAYRYVLSLQLTALLRNYSWYVGGFILNTELMRQCSALIVGEHDFTSFCKADSGVNDNRCIVENTEWKQEGPTLVFKIVANRFLYGMVRALVGTMVEIGRGYRPFDDFQRILAAHDRRAAGMAAPAKGLFLQQIIY
jgi:tRNA pseudouridine38-40 synthase